MHPRSVSRAAITATSLRREPQRPALRLVTPACAFGVVGGSLVVTRAFEINWPFTGTTLDFPAGTTLDFPAGTEIDLVGAEDWIGGESIVIGAQTRTVMATRQLHALPQRLAAASDTILGGFDLDQECAVLAGSFWDANLESVAPPPTNPVVAQMADYFVERRRDGFDDTTHIDLVRQGFAETDILRHHGAATTLAAEQLRDTDIDASRTSYDRQARVMLGATALAGEIDPNRVHTCLRLAGLTTPEIGKLFDDIIGESLRLVREGHAALAEVA